jgi:hypothetical protein
MTASLAAKTFGKAILPRQKLYMQAMSRKFRSRLSLSRRDAG